MKFQISNQTLLNADWREFLPTLPDDSVDLLLTDPPYGTTSIDWDKKVEWSLFWEQIKRICKPDAPMVIFASGKFINELINSNPKDYRYELIWEKPRAVGFLDANRRPLRAHEQILIFTRKGFRNSTYNPQMVAGKPHKTGGEGKQAVHYGGKRGRTEIVTTSLYHPRSVLKYSNQVKGKSLHPTAKPLELVEWLVRSYSNEGDVVLDPFSGSGTTLAACMIAGRNGIGCEIDETYFHTAANRLEEVEAAL
jgi:site-specific DNA-methyltransferase (adenine-specific)